MQMAELSLLRSSKLAVDRHGRPQAMLDTATPRHIDRLTLNQLPMLIDMRQRQK
jgi:hypothetical protein